LRFSANIKEGKITIRDQEGFDGFLKTIDGDAWIYVKSASTIRSPQQNAYYRHSLRQLANHLGYNEDEMHNVIKEKFKVESTKHLDIDEFSELIDRVIRLSAELGCVIKDPRGC
tara:strand:- start:57 stop:398 length:342 start_codon:yes stop_codon:yes gene_type:complete